jgi:hypothetical protein
MSRSVGRPFAVLSSNRSVNNLAIAPCVIDAGHASRASRIKRAVGLERAPNQYRIQTPSPTFWEPPCRDAACAIHILILSFGLYGHLPSHNNAYVFFDYTSAATHRRVRTARNETLTVASTAPISHRFTPSMRNADLLAAGRIRDPPRCADAEPAYPTFVKEAAASAPHVLRVDASDRRCRIQNLPPPHQRNCGPTDLRPGSA